MKRDSEPLVRADATCWDIHVLEPGFRRFILIVQVLVDQNVFVLLECSFFQLIASVQTGVMKHISSIKKKMNKVFAKQGCKKMI